MDMERVNVMVVASKFVLSGVNQEPGSSVIKPAMGVNNYVERLIITVFRHYVNNYGREASELRVSTNNILVRVKGRGGGGIHPCVELCRKLETSARRYRRAWSLYKYLYRK